ncbi:hypothetical protein T484DRAFT_1803878 [Baffinella frigidus]|nr:hypothetical protein T484DRAFT_1803878 [Cryptophyta sp. CCMP2293]
MPSSGSGEAEEEALRSSALRQVGSETGLREMALKKLGAGKEGGVTVKLEEESNDYCEKPDAPKELQKGDKVWYRNSDGTYARVEDLQKGDKVWYRNSDGTYSRVEDLQKGDTVWFRSSDGTCSRVEVVRIDYSVQPESFEILINGGHRETNRNSFEILINGGHRETNRNRSRPNL